MSKRLFPAIAVLFIFTLVGCVSATKTTDQSYQFVEMQLEGQLVKENVDTGSRFFMKTEGGSRIELKSDLYDLSDYASTELEVNGVTYTEDDRQILVVKNLKELNVEVDEEPEEELNEEEQGDDMELESETIVDSADVPEISLESISVDESKYSELESRSLGFKVSYPKDWYYAQVGSGYAFSEKPVNGVESWIVYLAKSGAVDEGFKLSNPDAVTIPFKVNAVDFVIMGKGNYETVLKEIAATLSLL